MSVIRGVTNSYGPATLDIQIEQGSEFELELNLQRNGSDWDITDATITAHFSSKWSPGGTCIDLTVTKAGTPTNQIFVTFPAASSLALNLPSPPQTLPKSSFDSAPRKFQLGGWILTITPSGGTAQRIFDGDVTLDRDPCLT
jgi:hypothetical protein